MPMCRRSSAITVYRLSVASTSQRRWYKGRPYRYGLRTTTLPGCLSASSLPGQQISHRGCAAAPQVARTSPHRYDTICIQVLVGRDAGRLQHASASSESIVWGYWVGRFGLVRADLNLGRFEQVHCEPARTWPEPSSRTNFGRFGPGSSCQVRAGSDDGRTTDKDTLLCVCVVCTSEFLKHTGLEQAEGSHNS